MKTVHWRDDVSISGNQGRTHVVIVAVTEYEDGFENFPAFGVTADSLAVFWENVAKGHTDFSVNDKPVAAITLIRATPGAQATVGNVKEAMRETLLTAVEDDRLIFHWIGHGHSIAKDQFLALPMQSFRGRASSREGFSLNLLTSFIAQNCKALSQVFFFDCCSSPLPRSLEVNLNHPEMPSGFERDLVRVPEVRHHYILVGSGIDEPAYSPEDGVSFFATALMTTLNDLPKLPNGKHVTCSAFRDAVAQCIQNQMVEANLAGLPEHETLSSPGYWAKGFVQEFEAYRPAFRKRGGAIFLGQTRKQASTSCFVWHRDASRLESPSIAIDQIPGLRTTLYAQGLYADTPLRAVIGKISRTERIKVSLRSNSVEVASREWHGEGPVIRHELSEEAIDG